MQVFKITNFGSGKTIGCVILNIQFTSSVNADVCFSYTFESIREEEDCSIVGFIKSKFKITDFSMFFLLELK